VGDVAKFRSRDSSVGIVTPCGVVDTVLKSQHKNFLVSKTSVHTVGPTHPAIQCLSGFFPGGKAGEEWSWPLTFM
jgi:hypothetical protein